MGHEIERTDRFGEVRSAGQRAWHYLGDEIPDGLTVRQGFELVGLDWETELIRIRGELITPEGVETIDAPDHRMHVRKDTRGVLGILSKDYSIFSNQNLADFADALVREHGGVVMETGGSLRNGKRVFALVKLPAQIVVTDEDVVDQYLAITNSHDGSASFAIYPTSVRIVCANTLRWSEGDLAKGLRIRHTGDLQEKLAQARAVLGLAFEEAEKFAQQVKYLARRKLTVADARDFMLRTWEATYGEIDLEADAEHVAKLIKRRDELVDKWMANFDADRQMLRGIEHTAWSAMNAVTEYHDHQAGRFKQLNESNSRVHSNLFGASAKRKLSAFRTALAVASE